MIEIGDLFENQWAGFFHNNAGRIYVVTAKRSSPNKELTLILKYIDGQYYDSDKGREKFDVVHQYESELTSLGWRKLTPLEALALIQ